jgi:hypothetical protein
MKKILTIFSSIKRQVGDKITVGTKDGPYLGGRVVADLSNDPRYTKDGKNHAKDYYLVEIEEG